MQRDPLMEKAGCSGFFHLIEPLKKRVAFLQ